jgi:hypothetical protein
MTCLTAE